MNAEPQQGVRQDVARPVAQTNGTIPPHTTGTHNTGVPLSFRKGFVISVCGRVRKYCIYCNETCSIGWDVQAPRHCSKLATL